VVHEVEVILDTKPLLRAGGNILFLRGEDCAEIKDQSRSSKAIQEDRDRKVQSEKGVCSTYPDEEIGQQEKGFEKTQISGERECKRDQEVDPLYLKVNSELEIEN
jgi:hypothetical protein